MHRTSGAKGRSPECRDAPREPYSEPLRAATDFHRLFRLPQQSRPVAEISPELAALRIALLEEEVRELTQAISEADLIGIADALADIVCVVYGTAVTYGIDLDAVVQEVHKSNMTKLDSSGRPLLRADGKVIKSDQYIPPDIAGVLANQRPLPH
jgi:predicted HAD superfamily Cof-like phosphohydrolase